MKNLISFLLISFCFNSIVQAQDLATLREKIDGIAGEHLKKTDGIGFAIIVYNKGQKEYFY